MEQTTFHGTKTNTFQSIVDHAGHKEPHLQLPMWFLMPSMIHNRFNIKFWKNLTTPVGLNAQAIINCRAGGDCNGGDPSDVYAWA